MRPAQTRLLAGTRWKSHVERAWLAGATESERPGDCRRVCQPAGGAGAPQRRASTDPHPVAIHAGGMVICDRPIADVCPVEWARMENRSVLQWDKDDCAAIGLVKFDLLGLGMLSALHYVIDLVAEHKASRWTWPS